jgi:aromatic ring-opening dioxygenase catalytic subunit (LigB family)
VPPAGFDPAFSHQLELDHGVMTVYHELGPQLQLPLVPIVKNCTVHPTIPLRRCYEFGVALVEAIRCYDGLDRVTLGACRSAFGAKRLPACL